jgi:hypothetical protein
MRIGSKQAFQTPGRSLFTRLQALILEKLWFIDDAGMTSHRQALQRLEPT